MKLRVSFLILLFAMFSPLIWAERCSPNPNITTSEIMEAIYGNYSHKFKMSNWLVPPSVRKAIFFHWGLENDFSEEKTLHMKLVLSFPINFLEKQAVCVVSESVSESSDLDSWDAEERAIFAAILSKEDSGWKLVKENQFIMHFGSSLRSQPPARIIHLGKETVIELKSIFRNDAVIQESMSLVGFIDSEFSEILRIEDFSSMSNSGVKSFLRLADYKSSEWKYTSRLREKDVGAAFPNLEVHKFGTIRENYKTREINERKLYKFTGKKYLDLPQ